MNRDHAIYLASVFVLGISYYTVKKFVDNDFLFVALVAFYLVLVRAIIYVVNRRSPGR